MAIFEYTALTSKDRLMKGSVEAGSREEAEELLQVVQTLTGSLKSQTVEEEV